ncbi:MAG: hypothetical protein AAF660_00930 [Pseudomonadota bacterium]
MTDEAPKPAPDTPKSTALKERVSHLGRRSREELTRKGGIPDTAHGAFRTWSRKIWELRGGGAYAMGFLVTFLYLETVDILFDDVPKLYAMQSFASEITPFVIEFLIDTLLNTMWAFMWPVIVLQWEPPFGLIALVAFFVLFPKFVQKPLEHWLYEGEEPPPIESRKAERAEKEAAKKAARKAAKAEKKAEKQAAK